MSRLSLLAQALGLVLVLGAAGCARCERAIGTVPEPDEYVIVLRAIGSAEKAFEARDVLTGLNPILDGNLSLHLAVPESEAAEAYRRILNSRCRDYGVLIPPLAAQPIFERRAHRFSESTRGPGASASP